MATLVLTVVGGAIGGPIGAALGATIGQGIDRTVLFRPKGRQGPRLTDLAVQTSRYGAQLPRLYGTARVAGCVIWSTDLIESRSRGGGGKGQPSTTTYSYAASFAVALSARPIRAVRRIWADGTLLRGANGEWKAATGFRLHLGGEGQVADPLIASATGEMLAHRGIAYAVFENLALADFGNRIPSLTFEVEADAGAVRIGDVGRDMGMGVLAGAGPDAALTGFAASGDSLRGAAEALAQLCGGWFVTNGTEVRLADRAAGVPFTLPADARATRRRRPVDTIPAVLALSHYDPARDYQIGVQRARRPGAGWREEAMDAPAVLSAEAGRAMAEAMLRRADERRASVQVETDASAIAVAPGDAVRLPGDGGTWRVTRAAIERMRVTLDLAPEPGGDPSAPPVRPADPGTPVVSADKAIGRTALLLAELPPLGDPLPTVPQMVAMACGEEGWRSAALLLSRDDGATWDSIGATAAPAIMGVLAEPLARAPATLEDRERALEVTLHHDGMTLAPADAAALDRGANLALVGEELIQFADAVQLAPRRWRLARLWRARRGTAPASHAAGSRFALIEPDTVRVLTLSGTGPGTRVRVMASGIGDRDVPEEQDLELTGRSIAPPAPVALTAARTEDGALAVRWIRRSRQGWTWQDMVDAPLAEESERYRVRVTGDESIERLVEAPVLILAAEEVPAGTLTITVRQLGTLAPSPETIITLEEEA